ncbi:apolipoprotein N-acyltransferase [Ruania albidiflava]|uniref:apolipoprotein N-acyltransferase n=1 Tax=Ruania albidiflava TaxID=366586 RepID=UPI0023F414A3|nr:apolipoprotein N-acyltransferase [Ruania albidiflava]
MAVIWTPRALSLLVAALGGWATDAAFPMRGWWPLAFVGMAALVWACGRDSARWNALVGWVWGLGFFLPHLWWAHYAVGPVPWVALSVAESGILAGGVAAFTWARRGRWVRHRTWLHAPLFATIWVVIEQLRQVWPFGGFPWGRLGFSQGDSPLLSLATIAGAPLVSFAVVLIGHYLADAVRLLLPGPGRRDEVPAHRHWRQPAYRLVAGGLVLGVGAVLPLPSTQAEEGVLRVGAVQGNVSEPGLGAFANAQEVLHNHARGTHELADEVGQGNLDLVVWPENATDINPRADAQAAAEIDAAAEAIDAPILLGTDRYDDEARYNEMILWQPGVGSTYAYAKQIPAAFAEYIPMREVARLFSPAVDMVRTDMAAGQEVGVVPVPVPRTGEVADVGTVICFEVAYDALIRSAVQDGAEFLLVPTNNASFGYTSESEQQLAMSRLRAVEHGRTTLQISTVGVSGVIAPDGTVLEETGLFTHESFAADIPLRSTLTIADRLGDWPMIVFTVLAVLALALGVVTGRRQRPRPAGAEPAEGAPVRTSPEPATGSDAHVGAAP